MEKTINFLLEQKAGESDAAAAQRLADEELAQRLQNEEREHAAAFSRSGNAQGEDEPQSLTQDLEELKNTVVAGAKVGFEKVRGHSILRRLMPPTCR